MLLGTTGTASAIGPAALGAVGAAAWRTVIGAAGLWALARFGRSRGSDRPVPHRWVISGGLAFAVNQLAFFGAITRSGVAVGTLVTVGALPLAAGITDRVVHGRSPGTRWMLGAALAVAGIAVITRGGRSGGELRLDGVLFALVAAAFVPVLGLAAQQMFQVRSVIGSMAGLIGTGAVALAPLAAVTAPEAFRSLASLATVAYLGLVTLTAAYGLWGLGLRRSSISGVAVATLLEPAVAAVLAIAVVGERSSSSLRAGVVLVVIGVGLASIPGSADRARPGSS